MLLRSHLLWITLVGVVVWPDHANAQVLKLPATGASSAAVGTKSVAAGTEAAAQFVIPRFHDGKNAPAGQIVGQGPQSVLAATAATAELPAATRAIVITEGFGERMSQWQLQSKGATAAVLQPRLRDVSIIGFSPDGWLSNKQSVNAQPNKWNKTSPDLYAGFLGQAGGGELDNVTIFGIPGTAAYVTRNGSALSGPQLPFDRVKWNNNKLNIRRVFRGLWQNATDSHVTDVEVEAFRDYGVRLGTYRANGAIQFARIHCYGGGMLAAENTGAVAKASGLEGIDGPAIWIDGDDCHGVDCYGENAPVGLFIKGSYAALDGFKSLDCWVANVVFAGSHAHVSKAHLDATAIGAHFANQYNTLTDSTIKPTGVARAIVFTNGINQTLRDVVVDSFGNAEGVGIEVKTTLTNCRITAHVTGGAVGIDFTSGGIGASNVIHLTTSNGTVTPAKLPQGWSTTSKRTTNDVRVNGLRFYPPKDEF